MPIVMVIDIELIIDVLYVYLSGSSVHHGRGEDGEDCRLLVQHSVIQHCVMLLDTHLHTHTHTHTHTHITHTHMDTHIPMP